MVDFLLRNDNKENMNTIIYRICTAPIFEIN